VHKSSYEEMRIVLDTYFGDRRETPMRVLDVGSRAVGTQKGTYREHMAPCWQYLGCDTEPGRNVNVVQPDPYLLPFNEATFDVILSGQCLEHVPNPFRLVNAMARVLRPAGLMILTAPWQWRIHRYPIDCWRILPDGMKVLLEDAGLVALRTWTRENDCWGVGKK